VFNLKGRRIKRRFGIDLIAGITKSARSNEFVVHCPREYDYRFASPMKNEIGNVLTRAFAAK